MIGLAARPGIEVEPMCSIRSAVSPIADGDASPLGLEPRRPPRVVVDDLETRHGLEAADEDSLQVLLGVLFPAHAASWRGSVATVVTHLDASTASVDDVVGALDADGYCIVEGMLTCIRSGVREGVAARGARCSPVRPQRLRGVQHSPRLRAVREDTGVRRAGGASAVARCARSSARLLPAVRSDRHPDRPGREGAEHSTTTRASTRFPETSPMSS